MSAVPVLEDPWGSIAVFRIPTETGCSCEKAVDEDEMMICPPGPPSRVDPERALRFDRVSFSLLQGRSCRRNGRPGRGGVVL
jgi:hypothetical protein